MARQKSLESIRRRIEELKRQEADLKAKEREAQRRKEERCNLIAGTLALEHMHKDEAFGRELHALLDRYVEREQDRALFGLPPKKPEARETENLSGRAPSEPSGEGQGG